MLLRRLHRFFTRPFLYRIHCVPFPPSPVMSNKDRVFVAVYHRPGNSSMSLDSAQSRAGIRPHDFHWGIWIEPKKSTGCGTSFDLEDSDTYSSVANPFGWRIHIDEHKAPPPHMLGRIMIGKMLEGTHAYHMGGILHDVPLPSDPGSDVLDAVAWIKAAVRELQQTGSAERFSVEAFMEDALKYAVLWGARRNDPEKINYTWSRTFP